MHWKLFANLSETAGEREVPIDIDIDSGATFRDALSSLLETHPQLRDEILDENGEFHDHIRVLRNSHDPFETDDGFDTVLEADDELALFPPVSGG